MQQGRALAFFTLKNISPVELKPNGWSVYFTSSQPVEESTPGTPYLFSHVNGDLFRFVPGTGCRTLKRNDSVRIYYYTNGTIINRTAAPAAPFIVWDKQPGKGIPVAAYTLVTPAPHYPAMVTAADVYDANTILTELPDEAIAGVFPTPVLQQLKTGSLKTGKKIRIDADQEFGSEKKYLEDVLQRLIDTPVFVSGNNEAATLIKLKKGNTKPEGYTLTISAASVEINAADGAGIFYGIQSLLAACNPLIWEHPSPELEIPFIEVADYPRFEYRSLSLDVARNFRPAETVLRVLDIMAAAKMNVLHFHFSDDEGWRIEIPSLPELTGSAASRGYSNDPLAMLPPSYGSGPLPGKNAGSGFYTRNEFIEILRYATVRHIRIIPEIESPGHSRAAIVAMKARYNQLMSAGDTLSARMYLLHDPEDSSVYSSAQQWTDNVMCVARPSVYTFIEKVTDELIAMYKEAGAPLETLHLGGDEVPAGAWEKSPVCQQLITTYPALNETADLWYYYFEEVNRILCSKGLFVSAWEEAGMRKTILDGEKAMIVNGAFVKEGMQLHVWNNVTGWGAEDLPYKLANMGYKVILSPVSNNYLDLAYYKHPEEPGYYWGGFQDIEKPFSFIPFDYYKMAKDDPDGNPVRAGFFENKERLTDYGKKQIAGIEGLLWAETLRNDTAMWYMLLPKLLGVAERAWAPDPQWAEETDTTAFQLHYQKAWNIFINRIAKRELPRLDYLRRNYLYRIPAPGVKIVNGKVAANIQLPGFVIRYTKDGSNPTLTSPVYTFPLFEKGIYRLSAFTVTGRSSRVVQIEFK